MKEVGMLVVSLRSVNFGFWFHLGCSRVLWAKTPLDLAVKVSFRVKTTYGYSFLLKRFVFRMAEASAKGVTGYEPQVWVRGRYG